MPPSVLVNQLNRLNNLGRHIPAHLFMMLSTLCHAHCLQDQSANKVMDAPMGLLKALVSFMTPLICAGDAALQSVS